MPPVEFLLLLVYVVGGQLATSLGVGRNVGHSSRAAYLNFTAYLNFIVPGVLLTIMAAANGTAIPVAKDMTEGSTTRFRTMAMASLLSGQAQRSIRARGRAIREPYAAFRCYPGRGHRRRLASATMRLNPYVSRQSWYHDLLSLNKHLADSPLPSSLRQLVEIRVSQITGCGFCLAMHSSHARKTGVTQFKLDTLAGWRDTLAFDPQERAALGLAEAMTRIGDGHRVDQATWSAAREHFDDTELTALLYLIGLINVFNRINIAVELPSDHVLPR